MNILEEIKNKAVGLTDNEGHFADVIQLDVDDYTWLYEQAKKLQKLSIAWVYVDTHEEQTTDDFYEYAQDILSGEDE